MDFESGEQHFTLQVNIPGFAEKEIDPEAAISSLLESRLGDKDG